MTRQNKRDIKINHLLERNSAKKGFNPLLNLTNYIDRLQEADKEEKIIINLSEIQKVKERGGEFVTVTPDKIVTIIPGTQIFVPFGEDKEKAIQRYKNKLIERHKKM